jgi:putative hemolysin
MNRLMIASLCAAGLLGVAACATQPSAGTTAAETRAASASAQPDDRYCLRRTGTRIDLRRNDRSGDSDKQCIAAGGRVYTREDLERTGEIDIADALRKLDPAIQ